MRDVFLMTSGGLGLVVTAVHAILGETKIFARAHIEPPWARALLRAVWQAGAMAWGGFALLLLAAPRLASEISRHWIVATAVVVFLSGAVGNAWATGGRHLGWLALLAVCGLAIAGW